MVSSASKSKRTSEDRYAELGFRAGLEIHQQLSGSKLFCRCPAVVREEHPDFCVVRQLRASSGESGEVDVAAAAEQAKGKQFVYEGYQDTTCLVELDEEPVSAPSSDAVHTAVMVARMLGMTLVDEVHVMRKVVVDGSNTSGFQRTMLIACDGVVGDVRVSRLCLEEDACKIASRGAAGDRYNMSRLGIPLLEITTAPDMRSPEHVQEVAATLGMVLRSSRRVLRGIGTIRQDVNVSIRGGARVEIKGVQDLELMPVIAEREVDRQQGLLSLAERRDAPVFGAPVVCSAACSGASGFLRKALLDGDVVGVRVPGWDGEFGHELFPGYRVGTELAGFAQVWGFGGVMHTDEPASRYGLASWDAVRKALSLGPSDAGLLLAGDATRSVALFARLQDRLALLCRGVPSEVRKPNPDGSSSYLRPMPGAARMYPETDVRAFRVDAVSVVVPLLLTERAAELARARGIPEDRALQLVRAERDVLFERWVSVLPSSFVLDVLLVKEKEVKRRHGLSLDVLAVCEEVFSRVAAGTLSKDAVEDVLVAFARDGRVSWDSFVPVDEDAVRVVVDAVVVEHPGAPFGALMGMVMQRLGGRADGKMVSRVLKSRVS